ncbi:MAG: phosphoglucomutase (alpha-D-glucose-1,6-bisphosphate-dependent) [Pseudomonadota bacterium]|nr:phosphoglucomutase (alpha-D-glucose-1,6-bisphosphate-dependent) [Pseudomonadota bacterium]
MESGLSTPVTSRLNPNAGQQADSALLVDIPRLVTAYFSERPDYAESAQRVSFGTSGHRGSSLTRSFNELHVLAMTQAICDYRLDQGIQGPLFIGIDTHALSAPAYVSALEVLTANQVEVMHAADGEYTPTPAVSHAILVHNRRQPEGLADGIVITPSHNPPEQGGFKYNATDGGPADGTVTGWIERRSNHYLQQGLKGVKRVNVDRVKRWPNLHLHEYCRQYVNDLQQVIHFERIRGSNLHMGVDPLGGAGVHYWPAIAEHYGLDLDVVNPDVDPTFRFMSLDWDGKIRMDPSSPYAMTRLLALREKYDIAFACDTDHDRHGIVTRSAGLLAPNHYLSAAMDYLFRNRPGFPAQAAIGKTIVSSALIDRVARRLKRPLYETPVGFKWFVSGLLQGQIGFAGEESAGATFLQQDGQAWTTDKDGFIPSLLAAEMTAHTGHDPGERYQKLTEDLGCPAYSRIDAPASREQKAKLSQVAPEAIHRRTLAGEPILEILTHAPSNGAGLGGIKVMAEQGWFAARPSGTEDLYKIYAESFLGEAHLEEILAEARSLVDEVFEES